MAATAIACCSPTAAAGPGPADCPADCPVAGPAQRINIGSANIIRFLGYAIADTSADLEHAAVLGHAAAKVLTKVLTEGLPAALHPSDHAWILVTCLVTPDCAASRSWKPLFLERLSITLLTADEMSEASYDVYRRLAVEYMQQHMLLRSCVLPTGVLMPGTHAAGPWPANGQYTIGAMALILVALLKDVESSGASVAAVARVDATLARFPPDSSESGSESGSERERENDDGAPAAFCWRAAAETGRVYTDRPLSHADVTIGFALQQRCESRDEYSGLCLPPLMVSSPIVFGCMMLKHLFRAVM
jgi:hypothetical protein